MPVLLELGRHVGVATLAGGIAGAVVGGLLGRVVMRVTGFMAGPAMVGVHTDNGNRVGDITLEGTIGLVLFAGGGIGVLGGVLYAGFEPWLRRFRPWHGLLFGIGALAGGGFSILDPSNFDFARFGSAPVNVAMFAALFVLFGIATAWLVDRLREIAARGGKPAGVVEILSWLALVPAALLTLLIIVTIPTAQDPVQAILFLGALSIAAVAHWRKFPMVIGYVALAVPLVVGVVRLAIGLPQLLRGL